MPDLWYQRTSHESGALLHHQIEVCMCRESCAMPHTHVHAHILNIFPIVRTGVLTEKEFGCSLDGNTIVAEAHYVDDVLISVAASAASAGVTGPLSIQSTVQFVLPT